MINSIWERAKEFKKRYPMTVAWRLKKNAKIVEKHLRQGEKVLYVFAAQKNSHPLDFLSTAVIAITDQRIAIGRKRVLFGYFFDSITPELFNDLKILSGLFWGKLHIDTVKEFITLSNIDKRALPELEEIITDCLSKKRESSLPEEEA